LVLLSAHGLSRQGGGHGLWFGTAAVQAAPLTRQVRSSRPRQLRTPGGRNRRAPPRSRRWRTRSGARLPRPCGQASRVGLAVALVRPAGPAPHGRGWRLPRGKCRFRHLSPGNRRRRVRRWASMVITRR